MEAFKEAAIAFLKEHFIAVVIGLVGLMFLVYGLVSYVGNRGESDIAFESSSQKSSLAKTKEKDIESEAKKIIIDVSGAVNKPGVYTLPKESRVQDAILAAGGLASTVDRQKTAQTLNLAAPLIDGAKLYIPIVGEQMMTSQTASNKTSGSDKSVAGLATAMININTASEEELDTLSGVGEVTAGKIIEGRPYGSVEELLDKKVVGQATFEKIRDQVTVY